MKSYLILKFWISVIILFQCTISVPAQQWDGSQDIKDPIFRIGQVGIGFDSDQLWNEMLTLNGALVVGNALNTELGTIQWDNINFLGYRGSQWVSLNAFGGINQNHIYTLNSGNVGIGTTSPTSKLELNGGVFINSASASIDLFKLATLSTENLPAVKIGVDNNKKSTLTMGYWTLPSGPNPIGYIEQSISLTAGGLSFFLGGLAIGKTTITSGYLFDVNGKIRANEIIVNTTGSDFVFDDDYKLKSLEEVESFIKENKHLPDIPKAKEVETNGVSLGEMQTKLLQKIEELTLYIIQQEKRIKELENHQQ